jgi:hypothetical protein
MRKSSKPALPSEARVKIAPKKKPTVDLAQGCNPCGASGAPPAPQKSADSGKPPVQPPVAVAAVPAAPEGPTVKTEGGAQPSVRASGSAPKGAAPHVQASATARGKEEVGAATGQKQQQHCTSGDGGSTRCNADTASVGAAQKQTTSLAQGHAAAVVVAAGVDKEYSSSKGKVNDVAATFSSSAPTTAPLSPSTPPPSVSISENGRLVTDRAKCIRREADELMVTTQLPPITHVVAAAAASIADFTHSSLHSSLRHPPSCMTINMRIESGHYSFVAPLVNQARHEEGRRQIEKVMDMDRLRQQLAHDEILSAVCNPPRRQPHYPYKSLTLNPLLAVPTFPPPSISSPSFHLASQLTCNKNSYLKSTQNNLIHSRVQILPEFRILSFPHDLTTPSNPYTLPFARGLPQCAATSTPRPPLQGQKQESKRAPSNQTEHGIRFPAPQSSPLRPRPSRG